MEKVREASEASEVKEATPRPKVQSGTEVIAIDTVSTKGKHKDIGDIMGLMTSIQSTGLINPIVVDDDNNLIAGYRRLQACILLKYISIEVRRFSTLSTYQKRKLALEEDILHKKVLSWQEEVALKKELHDLYVEEHKHIPNRVRTERAWSQAKTAKVVGVSTSALSDDIRLAEALMVFPELKSVISKRDALNKMYRLRELALLRELSRRTLANDADPLASEGVRFIHGDCFDHMGKLEDGSIDLIITDPPWGIELRKVSGARSKKYDTIFEDKYTFNLYERLIPEAFRLLKDGSHFYLFFGMQFYREIRDLLLKHKFDVAHTPNIWVKEGPSFSNWEYKPQPQYEPFFYAVKRSSEKAPRSLNEATSDIFNYSRESKNKIHPTEKPMNLIRRLLHLSSMKGDVVLDPFAGSASTLLAAFMTQRKVIGYEKNKEFFDVAQARLNEFLVQKRTEALEAKEEEVKEASENKEN